MREWPLSLLLALTGLLAPLEALLLSSPVFGSSRSGAYGEGTSSSRSRERTTRSSSTRGFTSRQQGLQTISRGSTLVAGLTMLGTAQEKEPKGPGWGDEAAAKGGEEGTGKRPRKRRREKEPKRRLQSDEAVRQLQGLMVRYRQLQASTGAPGEKKEEGLSGEGDDRPPPVGIDDFVELAKACLHSNLPDLSIEACRLFLTALGSSTDLEPSSRVLIDIWESTHGKPLFSTRIGDTSPAAATVAVGDTAEAAADEGFLRTQIVPKGRALLLTSIRAYAATGELERALQLLHCTREAGIELDSYTHSLLIDVFCGCGVRGLEAALALREHMRSSQQPITSRAYQVLMGAVARGGEGPVRAGGLLVQEQQQRRQLERARPIGGEGGRMAVEGEVFEKERALQIAEGVFVDMLEADNANFKAKMELMVKQNRRRKGRGAKKREEEAVQRGNSEPRVVKKAAASLIKAAFVSVAEAARMEGLQRRSNSRDDEAQQSESFADQDECEGVDGSQAARRSLEKHGLRLDTFTSTAILKECLGTSNSTQAARLVLQDLETEEIWASVGTYNALIRHFRDSRDPEGALAILKLMDKSKFVDANASSLVLALQACAWAGRCTADAQLLLQRLAGNAGDAQAGEGGGEERGEEGGSGARGTEAGGAGERVETASAMAAAAAAAAATAAAAAAAASATAASNPSVAKDVRDSRLILQQTAQEPLEPLLRECKAAGRPADHTSFHTLIRACAEREDTVGAWQVFQCMRDRLYLTTSGGGEGEDEKAKEGMEEQEELYPAPVFNTYVEMLAFCRRGKTPAWDKAIEVLDMMKQDYEHSRAAAAELGLGTHRGAKPNELCYQLVIESCGSVMRMKEALQVLEDLELQGLSPSEPIYAALIRGFGQQKQLDSARGCFGEVVDKFGLPSRDSFEAVIESAVAHPKGLLVAIEYVEQMESAGYSLAGDHFNMLIRGFGEARNMAKALEVYGSRNNVFFKEVSEQTFGVLLATFLRSGATVEEAVASIKSEGVSPPRALLQYMQLGEEDDRTEEEMAMYERAFKTKVNRHKEGSRFDFGGGQAPLPGYIAGVNVERFKSQREVLADTLRDIDFARQEALWRAEDDERTREMESRINKREVASKIKYVEVASREERVAHFKKVKEGKERSRVRSAQRREKGRLQQWQQQQQQQQQQGKGKASAAAPLKGVDAAIATAAAAAKAQSGDT